MPSFYSCLYSAGLCVSFFTNRYPFLSHTRKDAVLCKAERRLWLIQRIRVRKRGMSAAGATAVRTSHGRPGSCTTGPRTCTTGSSQLRRTWAWPDGSPCLGRARAWAPGSSHMRRSRPRTTGGSYMRGSWSRSSRSPYMRWMWAWTDGSSYIRRMWAGTGSEEMRSGGKGGRYYPVPGRWRRQEYGEKRIAAGVHDS